MIFRLSSNQKQRGREADVWRSDWTPDLAGPRVSPWGRRLGSWRAQTSQEPATGVTQKAFQRLLDDPKDAAPLRKLLDARHDPRASLPPAAQRKPGEHSWAERAVLEGHWEAAALSLAYELWRYPDDEAGILLNLAALSCDQRRTERLDADNVPPAAQWLGRLGQRLIDALDSDPPASKRHALAIALKRLSQVLWAPTFGRAQSLRNRSVRSAVRQALLRHAALRAPMTPHRLAACPVLPSEWLEEAQRDDFLTVWEALSAEWPETEKAANQSLWLHTALNLGFYQTIQEWIARGVPLDADAWVREDARVDRVGVGGTVTALMAGYWTAPAPLWGQLLEASRNPGNRDECGRNVFHHLAGPTDEDPPSWPRQRWEALVERGVDPFLPDANDRVPAHRWARQDPEAFAAHQNAQLDRGLPEPTAPQSRTPRRRL